MRATDNIRRNCVKTSQEPHSRCRSLAQEKDVKHSGSKTVLGLKEWAVNVAALRSGDQTVTLLLSASGLPVVYLQGVS